MYHRFFSFQAYLSNKVTKPFASFDIHVHVDMHHLMYLNNLKKKAKITINYCYAYIHVLAALQ